MASFAERVLGAARLDAAIYEEVEADSGALGQALAVVVLAAVSSGIGTSIGAHGEGTSVLGGVLFSLIAWFVWALVTYLVGTRILPTPQTEADLGQLLRTIGFAAAPGLLGVLGALPGVGTLLLFLIWLWQLAAMVVAVRQALDYTSTFRAVGVCLLGFVAYVLIATVLAGLVLSGLMAVGGTEPAQALP